MKAENQHPESLHTKACVIERLYIFIDVLHQNKDQWS